MLLIGMFDSPFTRSVAVTLKVFGLPFEHANWSVGKDFDQIRKYNPLGRVPTLVLDDGEALVESTAILDYLDERAGTARALLPPSGPERRAAMRIISLANGAAEKGREQLYERAFRPKEKWHQPWIDRCAGQMHGALAELEKVAAARDGKRWLMGDRMTRADVVVTCDFTLLAEAIEPRLKEGMYPALGAYVERCEALPEFKACYDPWTPPKS